MIRAVVQNGFIHPLEPLPATWEDGHEVLVNEVEEQSLGEPADIDQWLEDMKTLTRTLNDSNEWMEIEAALADADHQNKAMDYVPRGNFHLNNRSPMRRPVS